MTDDHANSRFKLSGIAKHVKPVSPPLRLLLIGFTANFLPLLCFNLFPVILIPLLGRLCLNLQAPGPTILSCFVWFSSFAIYYFTTAALIFNLSKNKKVDRRQAALWLACGSALAVSVIASGPSDGWAIAGCFMAGWYAVGAVFVQLLSVYLVYRRKDRFEDSSAKASP